MNKNYTAEIFAELNNIYKELNKILYEYETSQGFSYIPWTNKDGKEFYEERIKNIKQNIDAHFWSAQEIRKKLYHITDEVLYVIKSADFPGVPERWTRQNHNLSYFDVVYDVIESDIEAFKVIKEDKNTISFNFIPEIEDYIERKRYFERKYEQYKKCNVDITVEGLYQQELVNTFSVIFATEFSSYSRIKE